MKNHENDTAVTGIQHQRRIVVGVDGSDCAESALEFAAHEAARWGAPLSVVSAYEVPPSSSWVSASLGPLEEAAAAIVRQALAKVHELEPRVVAKGEHLYGMAGSVLVAESRGASMLVVGSRGRGEILSILLGSVSEHCGHHAACPVTIVH
jgi:nucleotide-binding universal stress UspA family protein